MLNMASRFFLLLFLLASVAPADPPTMFPPVRGTREMIGAANNFEVEAGFRLLASGGNAVDAGVAAALTAAVTEQARFGLGGEMPLIIKMNGKPATIVSGVGTAPAKATVGFYQSRSPEPWEEAGKMPPIPGQGIKAAILPGAFDGLMLALQTHGTKSFAEVAKPAIEYADGFPVGEEFSAFVKNFKNLLDLWPTSAKFFMPDGAPPKLASVYHLNDLAKTLRELAAAEKKQRGNRARKIQAVRDYFYRGPLAKKMAAFSEANGGLISAADLAGFKAEFDAPKTSLFHGYEIVKPGFWTQGPVMIQALNILEGYDLKAMGHNSPQYLHTVIEAVKLAFADRDRYYGDPKFSKIPEETLLSKQYAAERRKQIDPAVASMEHRPGTFAKLISMNSMGEASSNVHDTTCVNVVDRWGNVFSATPSGAWLPSVIAGDTGIPLSTRLQSFVVTAGHANQLEPGKRPRVTLSPTMVLKDGKPFLAMSTPGGDNQDQAMLQVILNILVFNMNPQEAVEVPRFQTEHFYSSFANHEFVPGRVNLEGRMSKSSIDGLRSLGHRVNVATDWSNGSAPTVIKIGDGVLDGAADPRRARFIFGR